MNTPQEWEQEFDLLYNGINSNLAPALDQYEKSVFLTMAQEQVVKALYSGGTLGSESFEQTESQRRYLDALVANKFYHSADKLDGVPYGTPSIYGIEFDITDDVMYITYEQLEYTTEQCGNLTMLVTPITQDEFYKTRKNPFRGANDRRALRLDSGTNKVEIVTTLSTYDYRMRYLKKPYPIILATLTGGDQINGQVNPLSATKICELDDSLHRLILKTAVDLAAAAQTR